MQDIYSTFEFYKIQESIKEFAKTELGKEKIDNLKMLSSFNDVKENLDDLNEMMSVVRRFGIAPISTSANALYLIDLAKKTGLLTPHDFNMIANDIATSHNITKFFNKIDLNYPRLLEKIKLFYDLDSLLTIVGF